MLEVFVLIGLTIFAGFFAQLLFERTKISDILILILLGILIGPVFQLVDYKLLASAAPLVGTIALITILFAGGMSLNIFKAIGELFNATLFTLFTFFLTALVSALLLKFILGWSFLEGMMLGVIIGGTSSDIVISIVSRLSISENLRAILSLESALTDALSIVFFFVFAGMIKAGSFSISSTANVLLGSFSIAAVVAVLVSIAWLKVLQKFYGKPFGYLLSLGTVFLLYSFVESMGANGAFSVLVFGLVLGSADEIAKRIKIDGNFALDRNFKMLEKEFTFFVRTFFFVYLGIVISPSILGFGTVVPAALLLISIIFSRCIGTKFLLFLDRRYSANASLVFFMLPRGLAAAVLAYSATSSGISPQFFAEAALAIIVITNLIATFGTYASRNSFLPPIMRNDAACKPKIISRG